MNKIKGFIFNLIRKLFWSDYDPNEEFVCGYCGKEMYHRFIFCSQACEKALYVEESSAVLNITENISYTGDVF